MHIHPYLPPPGMDPDKPPEGTAPVPPQKEGAQKVEKHVLEQQAKVDDIFKEIFNIDWESFKGKFGGDFRATQGILGMIVRSAEKGQLLFSGWVQRATKSKSKQTITLQGPPKSKNLDVTYNDVMAFDVRPKIAFEKDPISDHQYGKAEELLALLEKDPANFRTTLQIGVAEEAEARKELEALIDFGKEDARMKSKKFTGALTTNDLKHVHWKALDRVNFALTQEHLKKLADLSNEKIFDKENASLDDWRSTNMSDVPADLFTLDKMKMMEVLSRALSYIEGLDGKKIKLPIEDRKGHYIMAEYEIKSISIGKAGYEGLPGYVLKPLPGELGGPGAQPPVFLVARGTEAIFGKDEEGHELRTEANFSRQTDTTPKSVSHNAVKAFDNELEFILLECGSKNQSLFLAGHSLGGALVSEMFLRHPDKISGAYAFNPPGIGKAEAEEWQKLPAEQAGKLIAILREGDAVSGGGAALVGNGLVINGPDHALKAHLDYAIGSGKEFTIQAADLNAENKKVGRKILETIRELGSIVFK